MTKRTRALVNPAILTWAREERGYTLEEASRRIPVSKEKLISCESGNDHFTFQQFRRAAWIYRRPTALFFLEETPPSLETPPFRRLPSHRDLSLSPNLRLEIRSIYQKRKAAIDLAEFGPSHDWSMVGSTSLRNNPESVGLQIRKMLGITDRFPIGLRDYQAFNSWREAIESTGILVFLIRGVDVEEMRGLAVSKSPFPVIAVNRKDAPGPKCFTLLHEYCHILVGNSSLCELRYEFEEKGDESQSDEVFCNHVAGAALVPANLLLTTPVVISHGTPEIWSEYELQQLASRFRVSKEVILRRLLVLKRTTDGFYGVMKQQWSHPIPVKKQGTPMESVHERVLQTDGLPFTSMVLDAVRNDAITAMDASELLRINLKHLQAVEDLIAKES